MREGENNMKRIVSIFEKDWHNRLKHVGRHDLNAAAWSEPALGGGKLEPKLYVPNFR